MLFRLERQAQVQGEDVRVSGLPVPTPLSECQEIPEIFSEVHPEACVVKDE